MGLFDKKRVRKNLPTKKKVVKVETQLPEIKDLYYKTTDGFNYRVRVISVTSGQVDIGTIAGQFHPQVIFNTTFAEYVAAGAADATEEFLHLVLSTDKKIIPLSWNLQIWEDASPFVLIDQWDILNYQARDIRGVVLPALTNDFQQLYYPNQSDQTFTYFSQLEIKPHSEQFNFVTPGNNLVWALNKYNINAPSIPGAPPVVAPLLFVTIDPASYASTYRVTKNFVYLELL